MEKSIVKQAFIKPSHRGIGIGAEGVTEVLTMAYEREIPMLVGESWIKPGDRNSSDMVEEQGFERVAYSEEYFDDAPLQIGTNDCYHCTVNQDRDTCQCSGALYKAPIDW